MTDSGTNRSKKSYRKSFIILPIVFLLIGYLLFLYASLQYSAPLSRFTSLHFLMRTSTPLSSPGKTVLLMVAAVWITVILHRVI